MQKSLPPLPPPPLPLLTPLPTPPLPPTQRLAEDAQRLVVIDAINRNRALGYAEIEHEVHEGLVRELSCEGYHVSRPVAGRCIIRWWGGPACGVVPSAPFKIKDMMRSALREGVSLERAGCYISTCDVSHPDPRGRVHPDRAGIDLCSDVLVRQQMRAVCRAVLLRAKNATHADKTVLHVDVEVHLRARTDKVLAAHESDTDIREALLQWLKATLCTPLAVHPVRVVIMATPRYSLSAADMREWGVQPCDIGAYVAGFSVIHETTLADETVNLHNPWNAALVGRGARADVAAVA
jgi:hypothetical protein